jgi:hypothetical protein
MGYIVAGAPRYSKGERALVFLQHDDRGHWTTKTMALGKFSFAKDVAGRALLVRDNREIAGWDYNGAAHREPQRSGPEFLQYVRDVAAGDSEATADYLVAAPKPLSGMRDLEVLYVSGCGTLRDITPIGNLTNLTLLNLSINKITDISALANCTKLEDLNLEQNQIWDLSPLEYLYNLKELDISTNRIYDVSPLSGLSELEVLDLNTNEIEYVWPLSYCTNLQSLDLRMNMYEIYDIYTVYFVPDLQY